MRVEAEGQRRKRDKIEKWERKAEERERERMKERDDRRRREKGGDTSEYEE